MTTPGRHHCFSCDGTGRLDGVPGAAPCTICRGKGYWTVEDIRLHHLQNPSMCQQSCGEDHRDPWMPGDPTLEPGEVDRVLRNSQELIERMNQEAEDRATRLLNRVTFLEATGELDDAVYAILSDVDALARAGDLLTCDALLERVNLDGMSEDVMVAWLGATLPIKLRERAKFVERVRVELVRREVPAVEIDEILDGLE